MDKRISYKLIIDTETCPINTETEEVIPSNMFVYDIGWAVVDKRGTVYKTESFINKDIFCYEKNLMKSAYYANKIPQYEEDIKNGKRILANLYTIKTRLLDDIKHYNIKEVFGHNMRFDVTALNVTQCWVTKSKYRYFFPYNVDICDTLKMARDVILKMPTYRKFCVENNYLTKNHQLRATAEILYRFINQTNDFKESHTALEDVMIEKEILAYCYKQHKKMRKKLYE